MTTSSTPSDGGKPRDAAYWAQQVSSLKVSRVPTGALNLNVEGRRAVGPLEGFGPMWQKTYRIRLGGTTVQPTEVIKTWKEHFQEFWPAGSRFYGPLTGIAPGEVALLNLAIPGGMQLSTGVLVLYADDESFTLMTPQGHMFAGWITFSSFKKDSDLIAQALVLMRANDPVYELGLRFGGQRQEDNFWRHTLTQLGKYFNVTAPVELETVCVDRRRQWRYIRNVRHNSAIRTILTIPARWFGGG